MFFLLKPFMVTLTMYIAVSIRGGIVTLYYIKYNYFSLTVFYTPLLMGAYKPYVPNLLTYATSLRTGKVLGIFLQVE